MKCKILDMAFDWLSNLFLNKLTHPSLMVDININIRKSMIYVDLLQDTYIFLFYLQNND